jgi:hypothetical protein
MNCFPLSPGKFAVPLSVRKLVTMPPLTFEALKVFLDPINSRSAPSYEEVASRIQVSTGAAKTLIHRLRKRFTALLREEVGRTVSDPSEVDGEIHALCEALIASGGRIKP